jgi:hypothetical protein
MTSYYCPNCSLPWSDEYCTDEPTVHGDEENGWMCDICGCGTSYPEADGCVPAENKAECLDVIQECNSCGARATARYRKNGWIDFLDTPCECEDTFSPADGGPSISEWLQSISS